MASTGNMNIAFGVTGGDSVSREAKRIEQSLNKLVSKIDHQAKSLAMSAREMDLYKAATLKADGATIGHINALHDSIDAQMRQAKEIQNTIDKSKAEAKQKQLLETQERERVDSINSIISQLQREQDELGQSSDEIQIRKAMMQGATDAELSQIQAMQQSIAAHKAKLAEQKKTNLATQQAQKEENSQKQSVDRLVTSLREYEATLGMSEQQIHEYKAAQMGATKAQIDAIGALHRDIEAKKKAQKATGGMNNSLRLMRGGFGQVGHQIQDISVQMQMGTNGMIVFGQQGSQIASLFGSGGAIIGAFLAVGAAIYTYVNSASVEAEKKLKALKDEMIELSLSAKGLEQGLSGVAVVALAREMELLKNQSKELKEEFSDATDTIAESKVFKNNQTQIQGAAGAFSALASSVIYSDKSIKDANETIKLNNFFTKKLTEDTVKAAEKRRRILAGEADPLMEFADKSKDFRKELKKQQEELGKTADQIMMLNAIRNAGGDKKVEAQNVAVVQSYINARIETENYTDALNAYNEALKESMQIGKDKNSQDEARIKREADYIASIQKKSEATALDKYETVLQSKAYKELAPYQKLQVRLALDLWKVNDAAIKQKAIEDNLAKKKIETIDGTIASLNRENEVLKLQTEQKYTAAEAEIYYTLSKAGAEKAIIDETLALQANIKAQREALAIKPDKPAKGFDPTSSLSSIQDNAKSDFDAMMSGFAMEENALAESTQRKLDILKDYHLTSNMSQEEYAKSMMAIEDSLAASTQETLMGQFNQLASMFDQTTALGKAFYAIQQGMAAADAIIKGYQTSSAIKLAHANIAAMMPDPTGAAATAMIAKGEVMGNASVAMGFATAGAIAGQTIASFEGGGITFNGVRSGGIDGKGGRMALVHPNEKITDPEKGGSTGGSVNVSFTINAVDTQGFDQLLQSRRGQIVGMVQKAVNNVGRRIM